MQLVPEPRPGVFHLPIPDRGREGRKTLGTRLTVLVRKNMYPAGSGFTPEFLWSKKFVGHFY